MSEPTVVSMFWTRFVATVPVLESDGDHEEAMDQLLAALQRIDPRLYFHIGHHDDGRDLLISAEGHYDLGALIERIAREAPVLPRWGYEPILDSSILLERRNPALFPLDENGDVLWRMALGGDWLWRERDVDFQFVFPTQGDAEAFAAEAPKPVAVSTYKTGWQAEVTRPLVPTHPAIGATEAELVALAGRFGGRGDGWGCLSQGDGWKRPGPPP